MLNFGHQPKIFLPKQKLSKPLFPPTGVVTRNCDEDCYNTPCRRNICAAVAVASIVANGTGYVNCHKYVVTSRQLEHFLMTEQEEEMNAAIVQRLIERHEPDPDLRAYGCLSMEGFAYLMMDHSNFAVPDVRAPDPKVRGLSF